VIESEQWAKIILPGTASRRFSVVEMKLSKYKADIPDGIIILNYIMISDKNQVHFWKHPRINSIMYGQICPFG
jgi:hypothetical protein